MFKLIRNQMIPPKKSFFDKQKEAAITVILKLEIPVDGVGDCIEIDFNPEEFRGLIRRFITIRQVELNKWRVWRTA